MQGCPTAKGLLLASTIALCPSHRASSWHMTTGCCLLEMVIIAQRELATE